METQTLTLLQDYQPSQEAIEITKNTPILLLVGIAGAGKDTIKRRLLGNGNYHHIVSHTTRPPRTNNGVTEQDSQDYHFISVNTAIEMAQQQRFVELKLVHNTVYGTSLSELQQAQEAHKIAINDIDVQGVDEFRRISGDKATAVFLIPPSYDVWLERLKARYGSTGIPEEELFKRTLSAIFELEHALALPFYHFIVNDDLERVTTVADKIAHHGTSFNEYDEAARARATELLEEIRSHA